MVQLKILSGQKAGTSWVARRFPVRIGRSAECELQLEEPGVWNEHLRIGLDTSEGFVLEAEPDALVTTNRQPVQRAVLRNGDTIEIGGLKIQFWLATARRRGLGLVEWLVWATIAAVSLAQVALAYRLPH
jgi:pSer/pThr/pTyr-binding forkhead associated (FHA) protein